MCANEPPTEADSGADVEVVGVGKGGLCFTPVGLVLSGSPEMSLMSQSAAVFAVSLIAASVSLSSSFFFFFFFCC